MKKNDSPRYGEWYSQDVDTVVQVLDTNLQTGLTDEQIRERNAQFGENELPKKKKESTFIRFLKHFNDILIYVLLVAAVITAILGHYVDTIVIVLVAFINTLIGFIQESKAGKALENIRSMLSLQAQVIRNGERMEIDSTELTVGDVVLLSPGDKVPADMRLAESSNLKIEESILTGESVPSDKNVEPLASDTPLGDQVDMAFTSTTVSAGTGLGVVTSIGAYTELGKINQLISDTQPITTPLLRQTARLGKTISIAIVAISILVYLFGYFYRDYPPQELLLAVIGLAVAAIPEGLPAILSIILAIGVQNMAKRNAIIRNLPSVETLGAVSVICSDKTGTLTKNEMTVRTVITKDHVYNVSGTGYAPVGSITLEEHPVDADHDNVLRTLLNCFEFCNDSTVSEDDQGNWRVNGDPTEGALITLYEKADLKDRNVERIATIPFDSEYKYMAVLVKAGDRKFIFVKGAPDRLLNHVCQEKNISGIHPFDESYWNCMISETANKGQRLIGAAYKEVDPGKTDLTHADLENCPVFLGMAGIIDPPREEATAAIEACKKAGITVKMITGDHIDTAKAIGREMGIGNGKEAMEGKELQRMSDQELQQVVQECDIFARTSPEHKIRIVTALQNDGYICAMTGDGVNDAPALKKSGCRDCYGNQRN